MNVAMFFRYAIRYIIGFAIGIIAYAVCFWIGALFGYLSTCFQLFIPSGAVEHAALFSSALAANFAGILTFFKISDASNRTPRILQALFPFVLIIFALAYGAVAIYGKQYINLLYSIISISICAYFIYEAATGQLKDE